MAATVRKVDPAPNALASVKAAAWAKGKDKDMAGVAVHATAPVRVLAQGIVP